MPVVSFVLHLYVTFRLNSIHEYMADIQWFYCRLMIFVRNICFCSSTLSSFLLPFVIYSHTDRLFIGLCTNCHVNIHHFTMVWPWPQLYLFHIINCTCIGGSYTLPIYRPRCCPTIPFTTQFTNRHWLFTNCLPSLCASKNLPDMSDVEDPADIPLQCCKPLCC